MKDGEPSGAGERAPSFRPGQARGPFKLWLGEGWALDRCQNLPSLSLSPMGGRAKRDHSGEPGMVPVWAH